MTRYRVREDGRILGNALIFVTAKSADHSARSAYLAVMSMFYLHIRRGDALYEDTQGFDARDGVDAVARATDDAREIMRQEPEVPAKGQWVEVVDDRGNTIRTIPFETVRPN